MKLLPQDAFLSVSFDFSSECTHIIVSLLKACKVTLVDRVLLLKKAWKVTIVRIECHNAAFQCHFKKVHTRSCTFKMKKSFFQNSANKMAKWSIVDIVKYLY